MLETWQAGGPLLIVLAGISVWIWASFFRLDGWFRSLLKQPNLLKKPNLLKQPGLDKQPNALPPLHKLQQSVATRDNFIDRASGLLQTAKRELFVFKALVGAAPLLGLLGTVIGMVTTFDALDRSGGEGFFAVAGGIRTALITTQFGLVVALPGVVGLARVQQQYRKLSQRIQALALQLPEAETPDHAEAA